MSAKPMRIHVAVALLASLSYAARRADAECHVINLLSIVALATAGEDPKPITGSWS